MAKFTDDQIPGRLDAGLSLYLLAGLCAGFGLLQGAGNCAVVRFDDFSIARNKGLKRYALGRAECEVKADALFAVLSSSRAHDAVALADIPGQQLAEPFAVHLPTQAEFFRTLPLPF